MMIPILIATGTILALIFAYCMNGPLKRHDDKHDPFA